MLNHDIILDESAFKDAVTGIEDLIVKSTELRDNLTFLYEELQRALDTPAGHQLQFTATDVLIQPLNDLLAVLEHTAATLEQIVGTGYYKDIFVEFEELNQSIR